MFSDFDKNPKIFLRWWYLAPRDRWVHKSIIFVNKKSNFWIKNLIISITIVLVVFPGALEPYFYLQKIFRSKFANFILKKTYWKNIFSCFGRQFREFLYKNDDLLLSRWKRFKFIMGLPIILKLSPKTRKNIFSESYFQNKFREFRPLFFL